MSHQLVVIIDFGGPNAQIVARRVRECNVYCEIFPYTIGYDCLASFSMKGIIVTGGLIDISKSRKTKAPWLEELNVPVLEIGQGSPVPVESLSKGVGKQCLNAFLKATCDCVGDWSVNVFIDEKVKELSEKLGTRKVMLVLSGGVDTSVTAALLSKAIGNNLICLFVDTGLMHKDETEKVLKAFSNKNITCIKINAETRFLYRLVGINDPERKRQIIEEEYIRIITEEAKKYNDIDVLAQGTIYPDILDANWDIVKASSLSIVPGEVQNCFSFRDCIYPISNLLKDEVRQIAKLFEFPEYIIDKQSFPSCGLAIRCIGAITKERLDILRQADSIFCQEIVNAGFDKQLSFYFVIITDMRTTGIRNSRKTYEYTLGLRAGKPTDSMISDFAELPYDLLRAVVRRITTELNNVSRVVYDVTSTPPSTVEWE